MKTYFIADTNALNRAEFEEYLAWMGDRNSVPLSEYCLYLLEQNKITTLAKLAHNFENNEHKLVI